MPSSDAYRNQAREIAELAERTEDPTVKAELLALAERFSRLADYVDGLHHSAPLSQLGLHLHDRR